MALEMRPAVRVKLRVGERVRVRSFDEIRSTLDARGCLESLPFMPEMLAHCGGQFRVFKCFDKYSDYVHGTGSRRMKNTVLLEGVRCHGQAHGGCQALCQIIWKESWLARVDSRPGLDLRPDSLSSTGHTSWEEGVLATRQSALDGGQVRFSCQATEIHRASEPLAWWDPRQYWRDVSSGNVTVRALIGACGFFLFKSALRVGGYRFLVALYDRLQHLRGADPYPYRQGTRVTTPTRETHLRTGDQIRVKSFDDILATLSTRNKNRGLWFDAEMVKYCGKTYAVLCRIERLIDHKSGQMLHLRNSCVALDGVTNQGDYHGFNPRNEYLFWRDVWLDRVTPETRGGGIEPEQAVVQAAVGPRIAR